MEGYKTLPFFVQSTIIYDFTVEFCQLWIDKSYNNYKGYKSYSRLSDQMIQAGRSGKQNIAEGYLEKSLKMRIKLLGVARASLEELLQDYLDFLRQSQLAVWDKNLNPAKAIRTLGFNPYKNYNDYKVYIKDPESAANCMICLINQTNSLLDGRIRNLEQDFITKGGYSENLFKKRLEYRANSSHKV